MNSTTLDPKAMLVSDLNDHCKTYCSDLGFVPADKLSASPMGVARPPLEFTAECIGFNNLVADILAGKEASMPNDAQRAAFYASIDSLDKAKAGLEASVTRLCKSLDALDTSELLDSVMTPWGSPTTKYRLATICAAHMMYHDGQLNYIQSLYGDGEMHWG